MSWIWNVMISFSDEEFWEEGADEARETCPALEKINDWLPNGQKLFNMSGATGIATDGMDANVYGGGFKNFDIEAFVAAVEAQDWKDRANVQLFLKGDGTAAQQFTILTLASKSKRRTPRPKKRKGLRGAA
jgi:hypothetical protein